jgi:hypothetical protein
VGLLLAIVKNCEMQTSLSTEYVKSGNYQLIKTQGFASINCPFADLEVVSGIKSLRSKESGNQRTRDKV